MFVLRKPFSEPPMLVELCIIRAFFTSSTYKSTLNQFSMCKNDLKVLFYKIYRGKKDVGSMSCDFNDDK